MFYIRAKSPYLHASRSLNIHLFHASPTSYCKKLSSVLTCKANFPIRAYQKEYIDVTFVLLVLKLP